MENITAAILCGGKSTRIKKFKATLEINGKSIIKNTIEVLNKFFRNIVISSNEPFIFQEFNLPVIEDVIKDKDIFGGIYSVLKNIDTFYTFIVPCDMPFISEELINFLLKSNYEMYDITIFSINGKFQPLFAIYSKNCLNFFEETINIEHKPKVIDILNKYKTKIITEKEIPSHINISKAFFNINTISDYYKAKNNIFNETKIFGVVAKYSNSGKTTLIENLIEKFKHDKFKVGVLKHTVHKIDVDKKGKDTYRFYEKGSDAIMIDTDKELFFRKKLEHQLPIKYLKDLYFNDMDVLIVEGHKGGNFPKIELIKDEQSDYLFKNDSNVIAIVTNKKIDCLLPAFSYFEIDNIYKFLKSFLKL